MKPVRASYVDGRCVYIFKMTIMKFVAELSKSKEIDSCLANSQFSYDRKKIREISYFDSATVHILYTCSSQLYKTFIYFRNIKTTGKQLFN